MLELRANLKEVLQSRLPEFPKVEERGKVQGELKFEKGTVVASTKNMGLQGYFLKTEDDLTVGQFRRDGFTLNRLRPYTSWDELFPEAIRLWQVYVEETDAQRLSRIALRYINHLELPLEQGDDFSRFMLAPPNVPEPIPQSMHGFRTAFQVHEEKSRIAINIVQALLPKPNAEPTLILDIDAYKEEQTEVADVPAIEAAFRSLHDMKNRVFFNLVTEQCLQLFM